MPKPCSLPVSGAYRWTIFRARPSPTPSIHNTELITMDDVIIIGGSFAGLAGALQLGRARRKVTVLDTGLPRNRFAGHSHGLLGHDHKPPLEILAEARQQLARYPTIRLVNARADSISGAIDDFSVLTGRIPGIAHHGGHNATVKLDTGPNVAVDILFAHPRNKPSASLHESMGLATVDTPGGIALKVDERRETSMPGIYAAGDLANPLMPSVTLASSHGATAGISAQQSMLV